jgi:hypothetical protein
LTIRSATGDAPEDRALPADKAPGSALALVALAGLPDGGIEPEGIEREELS